MDFAFHRSISFSFGGASHCGAIDPPLAGAEVLQLAAREAELSFAIFFSFSRRFSQKFSQPPTRRFVWSRRRKKPPSARIDYARPTR